MIFWSGHFSLLGPQSTGSRAPIAGRCGASMPPDAGWPSSTISGAALPFQVVSIFKSGGSPWHDVRSWGRPSTRVSCPTITWLMCLVSRAVSRRSSMKRSPS